MIKNLVSLLILSTICYLLSTISVSAFEITSDPQYIVINFSDSFHFLDWTAPEEIWQKEVKPKAITRLRNIKTLLTTGTTNRKLAWSTLLEYTNYPLDNISENSPYVLRLKRMIELAKSENFPIFIPLNGFQWWDELPELWNWWDSDGNQTPGCTNDDYQNCTFKKLQDPEFRKKFIHGYNPENKWNVDWLDWQTPMKFNVRNWGSGDILVAPPANIVSVPFTTLQKNRFEILIKTISKNIDPTLFAGISIGTEVSLNAAIAPGDWEFKPYGYRAIQDMFCPINNKTCGQNKNWTSEELHQMRQEIIFNYFDKLTKLTYQYDFPKQRVYTHVWSEAEPNEIKYTNAIDASTTYFSRSGMSIYGKALNPLNFSLLYNTLKENGFPAWSAPEFSPLIKDASNWQTALTNTLDNNLSPAKLIDIYNEAEILKTPAIPLLNSILSTDPKKIDCTISEVIPTTKNFITNPQVLSWKILEKDQGEKNSLIFWPRNNFPKKTDQVFFKEYEVKEASGETFTIPKNLENGFYFWAIKRQGCENQKWTISTPQVFFNHPPLPEIKIPWWVRVIRKIYPL